MNFSVRLELRIDWSELDLFGHVNNVAFLKYIQAARVNYWELTDLYPLYLNLKLGPMLAQTDCQYKKPLFYPGKIIVQTRLEFIKNTSFGFHHQILDGELQLAAEAHDVMVMYNFNKHEKIEIPESIRRNMEQLGNI